MLLFLDKTCLLHKQTELYNQINTSTAMNYTYSLACFCSDTTDILNEFSCLLCSWFQYLLHRFTGHSKLDLNFHCIKNLLTIASGYLVKFYNFYPRLSLKTEFPALKVAQICCIYANMNISFLQNWKFDSNLAPPLLLTYQA